MPVCAISKKSAKSDFRSSSSLRSNSRCFSPIASQSKFRTACSVSYARDLFAELGVRNQRRDTGANASGVIRSPNTLPMQEPEAGAT